MIEIINATLNAPMFSQEQTTEIQCTLASKKIEKKCCGGG